MALEFGSAAFGAALGAFLNVLFERMAPERFMDFINRHKLSDDLQRLKTAMNSVRSVLDDAEEKEITKSGVKQWLDDLKNAFFEADDLLDEIDYEATRLEREAESRSAIDVVPKFLRPRNSFKRRLRKILETIEHLVKQKDEHGLRENIRGGQSTQRIPTTSVVEMSNFFGRQRDQEEIMDLLLSDDVNRSNLRIISIVGVGGMGKTTLAQLIYRHERVGKLFDVRGWVCVSEVDDVPTITRDIAKEVAKMSCDDKTLNQIHEKLEEELTGKKFLLVLDDVWKEGVRFWDELLKPLKSGRPGSTIIITTRKVGVAQSVPSTSTIRLSKLDSTNCWQLFCQHAFGDQNSNDYPHFEEIGKKIVKKCDGLPLAVKVMGGVLRSKRDVKDWENVLRDDLWKLSKDDILPVLRLSYRDLPSHLKQCFAYCSIFPKDYQFEEEELILLWMAEGFLIEQEGSETMEEVGGLYFKELESRSFFERFNNSFVMHDLINDLARVVAGDFCFRFENHDCPRTSYKLRYLSCVAVKEESSSQQLSIIFESHRLLRTFLTLYNKLLDEREQKLQEMIPNLFLNQQRIRVLSLSRCWNVFELSSSIKHMKRLRYLDLSGTAIESLPECLCSFYNLQTLKLSWCREFVKLPSSIRHLKRLRYLDLSHTAIESLPECLCSLSNLQTLKLGECRKLAKLPSSISHLKRLRYLDLSNTAIKSLPECLCSLSNLQTLKLSWCSDLAELPTEMRRFMNLFCPDIEETKLLETPPNMGKLIKLQTLTDFFVGKREGCGVKELRSLKHLGGTLKIHNLQNVVNAKDVLEAEIKCKENLKKLELNWVGDTDDPCREEAVLDGLEPHTEIEVISIKGYGGNNFPNWLESGAFPCLKELRVENCPNLKGALPIHLPSLTKLVIVSSPQLQNVVPLPHAPNLNSLQLSNGYRGYVSSNSLAIINIQESVLEKIGQFGYSFEEILITNHEPLQYFSLELFPKLKSLEVKKCPYFESLSTPNQEFVSFEFLTKLILKDCPKLKFLPEDMHSLLPTLLTLEIGGCPEIVTFPRDGLPLKLQSLTIDNCKKLIAGRMSWDLQKLTSLISFTIMGYEEEEMECFPVAALLPSVLTSLKICELPYLKSLNYEGLQCFDSFEKLTIEYCPRLQMVVPDEGLPSTLTYLEIHHLSDFQNFLVNRRFHDLTRLRELHIWSCPNISFLPEEGLPPNLISLRLYSLENLRSVEGLRHLTSLESLIIRWCPNLKTLPEEGLPSSLSYLSISDCPLLKKRYWRKKRKHWAKISHIREISLD